MFVYTKLFHSVLWYYEVNESTFILKGLCNMDLVVNFAVSGKI